jgi:beta-barrel assembly-enhancing protease
MNRTHRYGCLRLTTLAVALAFSAGLLADEPKVVVPAYNTMSDEQEVSLGREVSVGIEKEMKLSFIELPSVHSYVSDLGLRIAKASRRAQLPYSLKVVNTKVVNAFALPGGFIYVNRGLIEWARSESELAAVLGHEVGHVVGRHGANAISRMTTADALFSEASRILLGDDLPARLLKQAGGPVAFMAMMKYSRHQEFEADLLGYYNVQRAGHSADGMVDLFKHFGEQRNGGPLDGLMTIIQSHPAPADREAQIVNEMRGFPPKAGLPRDSDAFKQIQAELKRLPPPPAAKTTSS